nr:MAG TPA: hypothetical protein [Caudoviricetes sp.]
MLEHVIIDHPPINENDPETLNLWLLHMKTQSDKLGVFSSENFYIGEDNNKCQIYQNISIPNGLRVNKFTFVYTPSDAYYTRLGADSFKTILRKSNIGLSVTTKITSVKVTPESSRTELFAGEEFELTFEKGKSVEVEIETQDALSGNISFIPYYQLSFANGVYSVLYDFPCTVKFENRSYDLSKTGTFTRSYYSYNFGWSKQISDILGVNLALKISYETSTFVATVNGVEFWKQYQSQNSFKYIREAVSQCFASWLGGELDGYKTFVYTLETFDNKSKLSVSPRNYAFFCILRVKDDGENSVFEIINNMQDQQGQGNGVYVGYSDHNSFVNRIYYDKRANLIKTATYPLYYPCFTNTTPIAAVPNPESPDATIFKSYPIMVKDKMETEVMPFFTPCNWYKDKTSNINNKEDFIGKMYEIDGKKWYHTKAVGTYTNTYFIRCEEE